MKTRLRIVFFLLVSATYLASAWAQDDPPSRVGRLSYVQGQVSFEPAGVDEWAPAVVNRPIIMGDRLWSDSDGRAEIHLGSAALRLGSQTSFSFLNLDDRTAQIRLAEGDLSIRLQRLGDDETFEIDTPNVAVSLLRPGQYRLQVQPDGNLSIVVVRAGEAELTGGGQSFAVHPHQLIQVTGTDSLTGDLSAEPERDDFDRFCESRDRREERTESARYVSRDMVGYEDLDDHGSWREDPGFGHVWYPRGVAVGWAPYHDGHWAWVEPWGWTWVDDAPWGFAPFHYGRWAFIGGGWGWIPGPIAVRPVYAPALVAFVGGGLRIGVGIGVGWFPLGPGEVYAPAYHASEGYWNHVNVSNTVINKNVNITNIYNNQVTNINSNNTNAGNRTNINNGTIVNQRYANQNVPGAMTAVPQNAFSSGRPVARAAVTVTREQAASAQVTTAVQVAPTKQAVNPTANAGIQVAHPTVSAANRAVIAKQAPPPPPVPFAQKQQALEANPGRPLAPQALQTIRQSQPVTQAPLVRPLGTNLRPAPLQGSPVRPNQPAIVQQPTQTVTPGIRPANPDRLNRPANPQTVQPSVAPRVNTPDRPVQTNTPPVTPQTAQPNHPPSEPVHPSTPAPRVSNPDRPAQTYTPPATPQTAQPYHPPSEPVHPNTPAPRATNPDRPPPQQQKQEKPKNDKKVKEEKPKKQ